MNNKNQFKFYKIDNVKKNLIGFIITISLACISFLVVQNKWLSNSCVTLVIIIATIIQIFVHFKYFLHISNFLDYYWYNSILVFSIIIILIIVIGSMWIMYDLNGHLMMH